MDKITLADMSVLRPVSSLPPGATVHVLPEYDENGTCTRCKGNHYFVLEDPANRFRLIPCGCVEEKQRREHYRRMLRISDLESVQSQRFATWHVRPGTERAFECAKFFAENPVNWLILQGKPGTGKTHLAAAIANALAECGTPVMFLVVPALFDRLRATFDREAHKKEDASDIPSTFDARFEAIKKVPVLILDDLGTESQTEWVKEKMYLLVNERYNNRLPTVFTTNVNIDSHYPPRLASRLQDCHLTVKATITAADYRRTTSER